MARIKATVKGNLNFLVDVKRTTAEVLARTVDMLGERTATRARSGAPRGATRELAGSITYRGKPQRDGYAGEIRIGVDYSPFVLFGTKSIFTSPPACSGLHAGNWVCPPTWTRKTAAFRFDICVVSSEGHP